MAYDRVEPFGEWRADLRAGIVAHAAVLPWMETGKKSSPADFMPDFDGAAAEAEAKPKSIAEQVAAMFSRRQATEGG